MYKVNFSTDNQQITISLKSYRRARDLMDILMMSENQIFDITIFNDDNMVIRYDFIDGSWVMTI